MPNPKYIRGVRLERLVRDDLKEQGAFLVVRAAGSRGPVDLVAFFEDSVLLVQVKAGTISKKEKDKLSKLSKLVWSLHSDVALATKKRGGVVEYEYIC